MPLVSRTGQPAPDLVGERLAELEAPLAHGLVAHVDAAGGQHLFHHAQAQRKAEVEPNGVADDLARKAIAGVDSRRRVTWLRMSCSSPTRPGLPRQAPPQVDGAVSAIERQGLPLRHEAG